MIETVHTFARRLEDVKRVHELGMILDEGYVTFTFCIEINTEDS